MSEEIRNTLLSIIQEKGNLEQVRLKAITNLSLNIGESFREGHFFDIKPFADVFINLGQDVYQADRIRTYALRFGMEGIFHSISSSIRALKASASSSFQAGATDKIRMLQSYLPEADQIFERLVSIAEDVSESQLVRLQAITTYGLCFIHLSHIRDYKVPDELNERMLSIANNMQDDASVRQYALQFGMR